MNNKCAQLEARKKLLVARSSLMRLQIQAELLDVRHSVSWTRIGIKAATSVPVRSALFGWAVSRLGHNRVAQLLGLASKVLLVAKMTGVALDIKRKLASDAAAPIEPQR